MIYTPLEDSLLIKSQVIIYSKNKKVLDVGTGSGILAKSALDAGASSILASDVDKKSLDFVKKLGIPVIKSDLFSKIKGKFDLIIFNPPYLPLDKREDLESRRITSGGKKGDEIILRFLKQVKSHLNKNSIALLVLSSLTPKDRINKVLRKQKFSKKTIAKEKLFFETLEVWKITN